MKLPVRRVARPVTTRKVAASIISIALFIPLAISAPASGADTTPPPAPIVLTPPSGIPNVAPLPFTGVVAGAFTTSATMSNLVVTPNQGVTGTPVTIAGANLPANTTLQLTWATSSGTWAVDVQPSTVNYRGTSYTKFHVNLATVTTDANGSFSLAIKAPTDFGGVHDIYAVKDGAALAHGVDLGRNRH